MSILAWLNQGNEISSCYKSYAKDRWVWGNRYVFTAESVNTWLLGCKTHNGWHHIYRFEMPMIEFRLQRITQSV